MRNSILCLDGCHVYVDVKIKTEPAATEIKVHITAIIVNNLRITRAESSQEVNE